MESFTILNTEHFGTARTDEDGFLDIGGLKIPYRENINGTVQVYVRRLGTDLSIMEILIARHDGLSQEALDHANDEAAEHPLGIRDYFRHRILSNDGIPMTDEEYEAWADEEGMP